jgi:hypothetical protein
MRSRLPGKLRSSPLLLGAMIVKNRTGFAKAGFIVRGFVSQVLYQADQSPGQHESQAQKQ